MATAINDKVPALRAMPVVAGSLRQLFSPFAASRQPHSPTLMRCRSRSTKEGATASRLVRRFRSVSWPLPRVKQLSSEHDARGGAWASVSQQCARGPCRQPDARVAPRHTGAGLALMPSVPIPPGSGVPWSLGMVLAWIRVRPRAAPASKIPSAYHKTGGLPRDSQRTS